MNTTKLAIVLALTAALFYASFVLYGAWIDGRRQKVRDQGLHPTTEGSGEVHAREERNEDGSQRR